MTLSVRIRNENLKPHRTTHKEMSSNGRPYDRIPVRDATGDLVAPRDQPADGFPRASWQLFRLTLLLISFWIDRKHEPTET